MKLELPKPIVQGFVKKRKDLPALLKRGDIATNDDEVAEAVVDLSPDAMVKTYLDDCHVKGFQPGAVVLHIRTPIPERLNPEHWGFVLGYNRILVPGQTWNPIIVKWCDRGVVEHCHDKKLRIVHYTQDKFILERRILSNGNI